MPTEYNNGQIYLYDYDSKFLEEDFSFSFSTFYPKFSKSFEEIKDLYKFGFIYEEECVKSKFKTKNKAVLNNE